MIPNQQHLAMIASRKPGNQPTERICAKLRRANCLRRAFKRSVNHVFRCVKSHTQNLARTHQPIQHTHQFGIEQDGRSCFVQEKDVDIIGPKLAQACLDRLTQSRR